MTMDLINKTEKNKGGQPLPPIDTIMLFAAGLGSRMRHLTENSPKSLIPVLGKPILHHALDLCKTYPFKKIVINTHYLRKQVESSLKEYMVNNPNFSDVTTIYEEELLETGGAIKNAKEILGDKPIFTLNTDTILRTNYNIFKDMIKEWNPEKMDFLLLLQPYDRAVGYTGRHGDFEMDRYGRLSRPDIEGNYSFMYTGLSILKPATIAKNPLKIFSLKEYYLNSQKIFGIKAKDARWYHASRPEDLVEIEIDMLAYGNI